MAKFGLLGSDASAKDREIGYYEDATRNPKKSALSKAYGLFSKGLSPKEKALAYAFGVMEGVDPKLDEYGHVIGKYDPEDVRSKDSWFATEARKIAERLGKDFLERDLEDYAGPYTLAEHISKGDKIGAELLAKANKDKDLSKRIRKGDESAIKEAVRKYQPNWYRDLGWEVEEDALDDINDYLDKNYPEEVEKVIEENPKEAEVALESMGQKELATEAKQAQGKGPAKEVNNEKVKKAVKKSKEDPDKTLADNLNYYNGLSDTHKALMDEYYKGDHGIQSDFDKNMQAQGLTRLLRGPRYEEVDEYGNVGDYSDEEKEYLKKLGFNLDPQTIEDVEKLFEYDPTKYVSEEYRHPKYNEEYDYIEDVDQDELAELIPELNGKSPKEIFKYLSSLSPKEREEKAEEIIEQHPEEVAKGSDVPEFRDEANDLLDDNPHNDEVNNEDVKKGLEVGKFLNEGYEDGMLKRSEEQQAEFDRIKEQSEREAAEWRAQQANAAANRAANAANSTPNPAESIPQNGEQPIESKPLNDADVAEEMKRFEGSKKRSTKRLTDMDSNPLESLEFNPDEFNKQYEIDHPELAIKDELSDDEKNDIDYKPSQEELDALNQANREEWEANGRPRNKDLPDKTIDLPNDFMDKEVERQIEENPSQAEQVAEESLGENNPIENEAEQAADSTNPQDDEVNNAEIASASTEDKTNFLNQMGSIPQDTNIDSYPENREQIDDFVVNPPEVVDYGLEDRNQYGISNDTFERLQKQMAEQENAIDEVEPDQTVYQESNLPELEIEKFPEEKLRKIFDPLNKEIEVRQAAFDSADEALQLAQMHFDENPDEKNAEALKKAETAYKDAEFLLNRKKDEFSEAYKNLGNYYQPKTTPEEKEGKPLNLHLPSDESHRLNGLSSTNSTTPLDDIKMDDHIGGRGSAGGGFLGRTLGASGGSAHPITHGLSNPNVKMDSLQSAASKAPIPQLAKDNSHEITRSGSTNSTPHSNGSLGSGGGLMFSHHTNYTSPSKIAPTIASLGHTSTPSAGIMNVGGIGGTGRKGMDPKMILLSAIESRINELTISNPELLKKLELDHKYKHWSWKGIVLDELGSSQLQALWKALN